MIHAEKHQREDVLSMLSARVPRVLIACEEEERLMRVGMVLYLGTEDGMHVTVVKIMVVRSRVRGDTTCEWRSSSEERIGMCGGRQWGCVD